VVYKKYLSPEKKRLEFMRGKLSETEISELLSCIEKQGFFELQDRYVSYGDDIPIVSIAVRKKGQVKVVTVEGLADRDGPASFWKICRILDTFDIKDAVPYNPQRITLFVNRLSHEVDPEEFSLWPVQGIDLDKVSKEGKLIVEDPKIIQQIMEMVKNRPLLGGQMRYSFRFQDGMYNIVVKVHFLDE
jgi:hypothetical protein